MGTSQLRENVMTAYAGKTLRLLAAAAIVGSFGAVTVSGNAFAQAKMDTKADSKDTKMVGGAPMYPTKNIIENAVNSKDHTTLVAAVKAAGLVEALSGSGPFTVFAPVNDAFENLPAGTVDNLLKPENKAMLTSVLTYHVVSGKYDFNAIADLIKKGKGTATLKTLAGGNLTFMMNGDHNIVVKD